MSIKAVSQNYSHLSFRIGCVVRDIDTLIPSGDFQLLPEDRIYVLAGASDMPQVMELLGVRQDSRDKVMIVGGGSIGARVAALLEETHSVTLIEQNEERAEELSHVLKRTECLHGDGSDRETLLHGGLLTMDAVVAATGDNETNIMTCVMAKHLLHTRGSHRPTAAKTIALAKREEYLVLASTMGIDIAVNKKVLAANTVLQYIRRGHVLSVAHLHGCDAEVVELLADAGSPITKHPLHAQTALKKRITLGAVFQEGAWKVAVGNTQVMPGDRVVCVCTEELLGELQRLFLA
jgi:trk system potassium uptake protein TrkA